MIFFNLLINSFFINFFLNFFFVYIKMFKILSAKYEKIKKDYKKKACERYQNLSKEEKEKKWQYGRESYKNLSEDEKQKFAEYRKHYIIL